MRGRRRGALRVRALGVVLGLGLGFGAGALSPQAAQGQGASGADAPSPWYVGGGWGQSLQQNPFGTQVGEATRSIHLRLDAPGARGVRTVLEGARVDVVGDCRSRELCPTVPGWTLRAGLTLGDVAGRDLRGDGIDLRLVLQGDVGVFLPDAAEPSDASDSSPREVAFAPAVRAGLILPSWNRFQPRLDVARVRYPTTGGLWEASLGLRVRLR